MPLSPQFNALIEGDTFMTYLRRQMNFLAEDVEQYIKANHIWQDDSGSLTASITGYEATVGDPYKHFFDSTWTTAQTPGYVSPIHKNIAPNFRAYTKEEYVDEVNNAVGIVTAFVWYGSGGDSEKTKSEVEATFADALSYMQARLPNYFGKLF